MTKKKSSVSTSYVNEVSIEEAVRESTPERSDTYSVYRVKCPTFTIRSTGKVCTKGLPIAIDGDELKTKQVANLILEGKLEAI